MRRVQWIMAALAALLGMPAEAATTIQLTVTGTYSTHYDGATGTVETFAPRAFTAVATLPLMITPLGSTPPEVYTDYDPSQLSIATPFAAGVGPDPVGNGLADLPGYSSAQAIVQTFGHGGYSSRFTLAQHLDNSDDVIGWSYYTRLSLCCDTPASLIDSNLYMTPDRLADFLALQVGKPVDFGTGWYTYRWVRDGESFSQETIAGGAPGGISAVLSGFQLISSVPEPATWATMILGFALTGAALRRSARRTRAG